MTGSASRRLLVCVQFSVLRNWRFTQIEKMARNAASEATTTRMRAITRRVRPESPAPVGTAGSGIPIAVAPIGPHGQGARRSLWGRCAPPAHAAHRRGVYDHALHQAVVEGAAARVHQ